MGQGSRNLTHFLKQRLTQDHSQKPFIAPADIRCSRPFHTYFTAILVHCVNLSAVLHDSLCIIALPSHLQAVLSNISLPNPRNLKYSLYSLRRKWHGTTGTVTVNVIYRLGMVPGRIAKWIGVQSKHIFAKCRVELAGLDDLFVLVFRN